MPRLFAALELPHTTMMQLSLMRGGLPGARFIDPENYHLTLRFMGDLENHVADEVAYELGRVNRKPFELTLCGLGVFGGKKPHSLFAVPKSCPEIFELQEDIERTCQRLNLPADPRKFTPHITIARLRNVTAERAAKFLSERGGFFAPPVKIKDFVLMSSRDSIGGGPYLREEIYPLTRDQYSVGNYDFEHLKDQNADAMH
jgi:2'-5' RNA ligase